MAFFGVAGAFTAFPAGMAAGTIVGALGLVGGAVSAVRVDAFLPYFFWRFVGGFPRVEVDSRAGQWEAGARLSLVVGVGLVTWRLAAHVGGFGVSPFSGAAYWLILLGLALMALPALVVRGRSAGQAERRRVRVLLFGLIVGATPILLFSVANAMGLQDPRVIRASAWIVYPGVLSIPFATAYAVLAHRALDVRLIVRKAIQYAMARYTLLLMAGVPIAGIAWLLVQNRSAAVSELLTGPTALALGAMSLGFLALLRAREKLTLALDRRFFREQYDSRRILRSLVHEIRQVSGEDALARVLSREVDRALHPSSISFLWRRGAEGWLTGAAAGSVGVQAGGPLLSEIGRTGAIRDLSRSEAAMDPGEAQWIDRAAAQLLVPLTETGGDLIGVIALGAKRSELPYTGEDRELLASVAAASALAVENAHIRARDAAGTGPARGGDPTTAASECTGCGLVQARDAHECETCGGALATAALPSNLSGKFAVIRRLGAGGGGTVYLAEDRTLGRLVALKALPAVSAAGRVRLEREARALASVSHPNLALIHGTERWVGGQVLVLEYVRDGTLADAIENGPLPVTDVISIAIQLLSALAHLHDQGLLHRDVKPSNIGLLDGARVKVLDLGLVGLRDAGWGTDLDQEVPDTTSAASAPNTGLTRSGPLPGTIPYMSPEALRGSAPSPGDDVWGVAVTIWQAWVGRHPFMGRSSASTMARILEGRIHDESNDRLSDSPALARILRAALAPDPAGRLREARDLLGGLAELE